MSSTIAKSFKTADACLTLWAGLIVVITVLAYIPSLRGGFVWDDAIYITNNPLVKAPDGLHRFWFSTEASDYYPLTWTLWWAEWRLWGNSATGYHVVSVLLHAINALLVWSILRHLKIAGAWLSAVLFAIHPVNVASVGWISEQKNTLSMLFAALAILAYLKFNQEERPAWYGLSLAAFILALLSKSAVVMLPVALLACVWWMRRSVCLKDLVRTVPFLLASLIFGLVTIWFQNNRVLRGHPGRSDSLLSRLAGAGWVSWFYAYKAALPINLTAIYPRWMIDTSSWLSYVPIVILAASFTVLYLNRKGWSRPLLFGFGYFVLMLFPVLGAFDQSFYQYSLMADHWQYYSIIGLIALAVAGGASIYRTGKYGRYWGWAVCAGLILALGWATWSRTHIYANSEALWRDTIEKNPNAWAAHANLGNVLLESGKVAEAVRQYEQALRIEPFLAEPHNNLGTILVHAGRLQDAIGQYEQALRVKIDYPEAQNNLGLALMIAGRNDEAAPHLRAAVDLNPNYAEARYNLAVLLANQGKTDEAISQLQSAVKVDHRQQFQSKLDELIVLKSHH